MNIPTTLATRFAFFSETYIGNTIFEYLVAFVIFIVLAIIFATLRATILGRLKKLTKKTETDIDDMIITIYQSIKPPFYILLAFYLAIRFLTIAPQLQNIINALLLIAVVYQVIRAIQIVIDYVVGKWAARTEADSEYAVKALSNIFKGVLWAFGLLVVLSNLGIDITSLIAGLGIGGIAVALALQNILSDLFSSFAIYFDKPFTPGDFIVVGNQSGTVERIGIKTTRIRSLQGEEIVMSNRELTNATVQNFKQMEERRVPLNIGVTYDTPKAKLEKIPALVRQAIEKTEGARFDRAHFKTFGDSALLFEIIYYVGSREYVDYMNANEQIHLAIFEAFEKEKIEFAFPTQTIYHQQLK